VAYGDTGEGRKVMLRTSASILMILLALGLADSAGAEVPPPNPSFVTMTAGGMGLSTCPAGDGDAYEFITVTALQDDHTPIVGLPSSAFYFMITGSGSGNVSIAAYDTETNADGEIRFRAQGTGTILYGSVTIVAHIYTVVLNDSDLLWCNTFDYDDNGTVDPTDFAAFASHYGSSNQMSDFNWDGSVDPIDFAEFASHYGH
jgi:hypothetical protein